MRNFLNSPDFISMLCGLAAFVVVVLVWSALIDNDPLPNRLKAIAERREELQNAAARKKSRREGLQRKQLMKQIVNWFKLTQGKSMADIRLKMQRAGYRAHDAIFVFLFLKLALLGGGIALGVFLFFILNLVKWQMALKVGAVMGCAIVGWMLPDLLVKNLSQKREELFRKALPDALDLLVICAEAGLSLDSALDRVSREVANSCPDLAEELGLTAVELSFFPDRHKALQGLAERVALPSVLALVNTLIQTEKYGTPLAQALRVLSAEMREDRVMRAEEKAAKLPAILTVPMIVFILPPLFIILIGPAIIKVSAIMAGRTL